MNRVRPAMILTVLAALLLAGPGCRTPARVREEAEDEARYEPVSMTVGRIVRVNAEHGYAVVRCVSLPYEGEEARVYSGRSGRDPVGTLRFSGPTHVPFMIADVEGGTVSTGDTVRVTRKRIALEEGKEKEE